MLVQTWLVKRVVYHPFISLPLHQLFPHQPSATSSRRTHAMFHLVCGSQNDSRYLCKSCQLLSIPSQLYSWWQHLSYHCCSLGHKCMPQQNPALQWSCLLWHESRLVQGGNGPLKDIFNEDTCMLAYRFLLTILVLVLVLVLSNALSILEDYYTEAWNVSSRKLIGESR